MLDLTRELQRQNSMQLSPKKLQGGTLVILKVPDVTLALLLKTLLSRAAWPRPSTSDTHHLRYDEFIPSESWKNVEYKSKDRIQNYMLQSSKIPLPLLTK
jgi:hypothetical protein